jgi:hypothetical protein
VQKKLSFGCLLFFWNKTAKNLWPKKNLFDHFPQRSSTAWLFFFNIFPPTSLEVPPLPLFSSFVVSIYRVIFFPSSFWSCYFLESISWRKGILTSWRCGLKTVSVVQLFFHFPSIRSNSFAADLKQNWRKRTVYITLSEVNCLFQRQNIQKVVKRENNQNRSVRKLQNN